VCVRVVMLNVSVRACRDAQCECACVP